MLQTGIAAVLPVWHAPRTISLQQRLHCSVMEKLIKAVGVAAYRVVKRQKTPRLFAGNTQTKRMDILLRFFLPQVIWALCFAVIAIFIIRVRRHLHLTSLLIGGSVC